MSVPDSVADPEAWNRELANAFEVLLGKPLGEFSTAAEYAFYYMDDMMSLEMLEEFVGGGMDLSAVVRGELIDGDRYHDGDMPFGWNQWSLDLGQSMWLFEEGAFGADGGFGESIGTALRAVSTATDHAERLVSGADLARVLAAHGNGLDEVDSDAFSRTLLLRIDTDGTLFDAMRAATWSRGGPDDLVTFFQGEFEVEVEPKWDENQRRIPDARLRDHLRMLSLTAQSARCEGAYYLGPHKCAVDFRWMTTQPGHEAIAGWEFGEGQASSVVLKVE